jgi:hypothetical protein
VLNECIGDLPLAEKTRILTERDLKTLNSDECHDLPGSGIYPQNAHVVVALGGVQSAPAHGLAFGAGSHGRREPEPGRLSH